jgi:hypothetical protein
LPDVTNEIVGPFGSPHSITAVFHLEPFSLFAPAIIVRSTNCYVFEIEAQRFFAVAVEELCSQRNFTDGLKQA